MTLAMLGIALSTYLTIAHFDEGLLTCGLSDCRTVQASDYADILGVPVAVLGLGMYASIFVLVCLRQLRPALMPPLVAAGFALALAGTIFAGYLTYVELFVLEAICQWCVASAVLTVLLLVTESLAVRRLLALPGEDW